MKDSKIKPQVKLGSSDSLVGKESTCNEADPGSIPESGRSPAGGIGHPLQYSGLENSMGYVVHGVTKSQTQLSDFHFTDALWTHNKNCGFVVFCAGMNR